MFSEKLKADITRQYTSRAQINNKIVYCQINLTHRCQYSCSHCYHREIDSSYWDIPLSEACCVIGLLYERSLANNKLLRVDFTGGDPLLYPNLAEVIKYCQTRRISYGLKCNPDFFVSSSASAIKQVLSGCSAISLSLDGPEYYHDAIRGKGSFLKVLEAAQIINCAKVFLRINATISRDNKDYLAELLQDLSKSEMHVDAFTWARYWSQEDMQSVISLAELPQLFDSYLDTLEGLYESESFFLEGREGGRPRINTIFKEHLWLPHLFYRGYIDKAFFHAARKQNNCLNCSAMKESYIVDSVDESYKCRKSKDWRIDLMNPAESTLPEECLGVCGSCINRNVCLGCPAMFQKTNSDIVGQDCPYYESY